MKAAFYWARLVSVLVIMLGVLLPKPLKAQSFYGSVVGVVTDPSGAVVAGANVVVTNLGTSEAQSTQSDLGGKFSFVNLVPATYSVTVERPGFKGFQQQKLTVEVGTVNRVSAVLQVGSASETVEVSTGAPLLQTDSSSLAQEITGAEVQQLPLNGRNVENLIALAPGVVPGGASLGGTGLNQKSRTSQAGFGNYQIGGSIQGWSSQYIDGVPNNVLGGNTLALVQTQDAVQEFSVVTSNATADFGRFAGGVVNMTTKSGANAFHGTAYEFLRNAVFNANDYFSNQTGSARPKFNQSQYGGVVSGPIKRDKLFFLFTYEGIASLTGSATPTNVPTSAASRAEWGGSDMQDGIFPDAIVDPLGNCNISTTANPGYWTITNLYQGSCGDPVNRILKTYYPSPNQNPNTSTSNFFLTTPLENHQFQYNTRVDFNVSSKQRLFGRYSYWSVKDTGHDEFLDEGLDGTHWPTSDGHNANFTQQFALGDTYTFNPTTVLDVRLNYVRDYSPNYPDSTTVNQSQFGSAYAALGPEMSVHVLPAYNAGGGIHNLYNLQHFVNYQVNEWNTYGINANLTKIIGAHDLKFGTELRLMDQSGSPNITGGSGLYQYSTNFTGDEFASFLLGYPNQIQFLTASNTAAYFYYQAYYATDTWQATRNLTLNLGLRWELPGGISERNNKATVLLPNALDPNTGIAGTLALVDSPLYPHRSTVLPEHNLFAPRLGLTYRIGPNTVIQGGYGLSYLPNDLSSQGTGELPSSSLVNTALTTVNVPGGGAPVPLQTALQGIVASGLNQPIGRTDPGFMTNYASKTNYLGQVIAGPVPYQSFPYVQQWNLAVSQQFKGDWMVEVAYAGLHGTNLPGIGVPGTMNRGLDELGSQYYSLGSGLLTTQPCARANGLVLTVGQCDRPNPYYNDVQDTVGYWAVQNYNSLQARTEKRLGAAGTIFANYTFAKNMANTDTQNPNTEDKPTQQGGAGIGAIQDFNNLAGEYSLITYDVKHRGIVGYVVNLPFGEGQRFGSHLSGLAGGFASGWAVNGTTTFQSGFPEYFSTTNPNVLQSSFGAGVTRPNVVAGCKKNIGGSDLSRVKAGAWFNTSCFVYPGDYAFGNESRVDSSIRSDGVKNFDIALQKSTKLFETTSLQFRTEFFNAFNRVQFSPAINTVGASNFGQVTYQANNPRQIQFSLRLNF